MTTTINAVAPVRAYVNHSRWVGDCTRPYCGGAELLAPAQEMFHCANCDLIVELAWPKDAARIWAVLSRRPVPQTRNWFPLDHPLAVTAGCPHGQSVKDLEAENREYGVG
jgi:hypothetical protein